MSYPDEVDSFYVEADNEAVVLKSWNRSEKQFVEIRVTKAELRQMLNAQPTGDENSPLKQERTP